MSKKCKLNKPIVSGTATRDDRMQIVDAETLCQRIAAGEMVIVRVEKAGNDYKVMASRYKALATPEHLYAMLPQKMTVTPVDLEPLTPGMTKIELWLCWMCPPPETEVISGLIHKVTENIEAQIEAMASKGMVQ